MSKAKSTYEILYLHYTHIVHYYAQSILTSFYLKQKHYAAFIRRVSRGRARLVRRIGLFFFCFFSRAPDGCWAYVLYGHLLDTRYLENKL